MSSAQRPVIGVVACFKEIPPHPYQATQEKYLRAIIDGAGGIPLLVPSLGQSDIAIARVLERLDGMLFTGSPSNVEPHHYQGTSSVSGTLHDPRRDDTTLPTIRLAVDAGVPVLGICRGFQEMNVALGGSLHQRVHEVGPYHDHRENAEEPLETQYAARHAVILEPGGLFAEWHPEPRLMVNSLHWQGVDRLAAGLVVEASAEDGLVEAFRIADPNRFAVAVQWHPEWRVRENPFSQHLFAAFGQACRARLQARETAWSI